MKYCPNCKKEVLSKGEKGYSSMCGQNCQDCCAECEEHVLVPSPLAVIRGNFRNPSDGLIRIINNLRRMVQEVDDGDRNDFVMEIEESNVSKPNYGYIQYLRYTGNGNYTTYTIYK